jgi:signal transduction histidine kinase
VFHYIGQQFELPRNLELMLYRVSQELLANILKHAKASQTTIQINQSNSKIMLMVEDDGRGFDNNTIQQGIGLRGIRERVKLFAGTIQIDSHPKKGTTTVIIIPID